MSQNPSSNLYADPSNPAMPASTMVLRDLARVALVVVDPQVDFLSPKGVSWPFVGECVTENNVVGNLESLFKAAKANDLTVAISPHYYYPADHKWQFGGGLEKLMHAISMFDRKGALTLDGFENSGADFMPQYKPFILDDRTIVCSPHKVYGPETNDLVLQLRKRGIDQVLLAGMAANLCVDSHLRELLEQGFEVAVIRDAVAAPRAPEGDGYLAAIINYRYIANALWTTEEALSRLSTAARG